MTASALVAAGQLVRPDAKGKVAAPPSEPWQRDAWDAYDSVPEVGQAVTFMGNVVGGVQLYIAERPENPAEPPAPAEPGPDAAAAVEVLERLRRGSTHGGLGGLLNESTVNLKVPGEFWLVGTPERQAQPAGPGVEAVPARPERWDVMSTDEVEVKGNGDALLRDRPGGQGLKVRMLGEPGVDAEDPAGVWLIRVWDRHPRFSALARSSLRSALTEVDELMSLSRAIRGAARSRYAGAGILAMDASLDVPAGSAEEEGDEGSDATATPFMRLLSKAMIDPIADEGNPDAVVPIVVQATPAQGSKIADMIALINTRQQFDPEMREIRKELLGRLGASLDIPIEELTGIAKVNHWGAWQISGSSWARYGQPTTALIVSSWTEGLLWPLLEAGGMDPDRARQFMIWFDPADAIMDPDESKTADELIDHWAIGFEAYRRRKGASEDEAPSEDDFALFERRGSATRPQMGGGQGPPNDGAPPEDPSARSRTAGPFDRALAVKRANDAALTAARRPAKPLGARLAEIDRRLRARLEEAAEIALRRALSRAGARVRNKVAGQARTAAAIAQVPNEHVCATLGPSLVAAQGLTEDDLLAGGIEEMRPRYESLVLGAQRRTRAELARDPDLELTDEELDQLEAAQDNDRDRAWLWLAGAMLGLARERLFTQGGPTGEGEVSALVPPSMLREAVQRAGGGAQGSPDAPVGGVATGELVMSVWASHGMVVGGWEWVHDEPDRPFPGHEALDGVQFRTWDDAQLLVNPEDDWLGVTHYTPGDHDGCRCDFVPLSLDDMAPDDAQQVGDLMDALDEMAPA